MFDIIFSLQTKSNHNLLPFIIRHYFTRHDKGICPTCLPYFGKSIAFFIWNAIIVTLEHFVGNASIFQWIKSNMPKPVVTVLVLSTAMPIAHWFLHPYTKSSYLYDAEFAFPIIGTI